MKKIISFFIVITVLLNCFVIFSYAESSETEAKEKVNVEYDDIGEITSCVYDANLKKVNISGNINHDVMVTHNNYKIALYAIPLGQTLDDVLNSAEAAALASTDISIKFQFSVNAETNAERFSRYAVLIYNSEGKVKAIKKAVYPSTSTNYSFKLGDKDGYKGVSTGLISNAVDSGVGTAIIPVYFEKLLSTGSTGYLYSLQGSNIYFDRAYIGELDAKVKSLSATGCKVYLKFLNTKNSNSGLITVDSSSDYTLPNMDVPQNINLISAYTDFLCDRYASFKKGAVSGIILGEDIDSAFLASEELNVEQYIENFSKYMVVVGNIARSAISKIDIVIPFSDINDYGKGSSISEGKCSSSVFLEEICKILEENFVERFRFSTLIRSESIPYGISDETLQNKEFSAGIYEGINADNCDIYSSFIDSLKLKYESYPDSFMFVWTVKEGTSGNVLSAAYSYSYFKLMSNSKIKSFVVSFDKPESKGFYGQYPEIQNIVKYIDTSKSFDVTAPQLELFGAKNWYGVIDKMYDGRFDRRRIIDLVKVDKMPTNLVGNYTYFDFSYYTDIYDWFGGANCDALKIDYTDISGRALKAHFTGKTASPSEYSEIYCSYDYPENFMFTPYMALDFCIINDSKDENALYEVKITYGAGKNETEISKVCNASQMSLCTFDMSEFCDISMADYIRIGVRCLTGDEGGYSLYISSMTGYSTKYVSEELKTLIYEERLRIRNMLEDKNDTPSNSINTVLIVAGIAVVIAVIGVGIFMCFKREDDEE